MVSEGKGKKSHVRLTRIYIPDRLTLGSLIKKQEMMASERSVMWAIVQAAIEAAKAAIMAVREAETPVSNVRPIQRTLRMGGPTLKQTTLKEPGKYHELCNLNRSQEHFPGQ